MKFITAIAVAALFTNCATIVGGSKYWAKVIVEDHPNAKIYYDDELQGTGDAEFLVKRSQANQFSLKIKEEGCAEQTFDFTERKFRGWALLGTIVGWTGVVFTASEVPIPLPWGLVTDLSTGALWKPDATEPGVSQKSTKDFKYIIDYKGCEQGVK